MRTRSSIPRPGRRRHALVALTAVALAVPLLGATPVTAATSFAATTAAARTPIGARTSAVQLPTGEVARVVTTPSGATSTQLASLVPGGAHSLAAVSFSGKRYLFPDTALPYLGGRLDRGLFDTAKLPAAGGRIPVRVSYTTSTPPAVPGVTYTSTGTGTASGYLTNAGARQFGVALAKKFAADSAARSFTGTTLFGATAIRATTSSGTVTPALPMRTVIVSATDSSGAPMQVGGVAAIRTDAGAGYVAFAPIINGQARLSRSAGSR